MPDANQQDLMQEVRSYLKRAYAGIAAGGSATGAPPSGAKTVLAFEPLGIPVSPMDFRLDQNDDTSPLMPMIGVQRTSLYSDWIRKVDVTGTLDLGLSGTVDGQYNIILNESTAVSGSGAGGFAAVKAPAKEAFDSAQTSGIDTSGTGASVQYHPVRPTPPDWYDPSNAANWSSGSFGDGSPTASSQPSMPSLRIRVVPAQYTSAIATAKSVTFQPQLHLAVTPQLAQVTSTTARPQLTAVRATTAVSSTAVSTPTMALRPITGFNDLVNLSQQSTPQDTRSDSLSVAFQYCLVRLERPWLSYDFLSSGGWYISGAKRGDLSSGDDLTGSGRFSLIPIALVAIKALKITANWSDADRHAVQNAVSIGAFSLVGRQFDGQSLTCDGMQIIGWVCASMPVLPPATDPALTPDNPLQDLEKSAEQAATSSLEGALAQKLGKLLGN